jgi:hypothetical protein
VGASSAAARIALPMSVYRSTAQARIDSVVASNSVSSSGNGT